MEIKGKTILSIRGSKGKEFLTISISSKGKDGKYTRVNVIVGIKDKEKVLETMRSKKLSALLIDVQNGFLTANEFEKDGKKERVICSLEKKACRIMSLEGFLCTGISIESNMTLL